MSKKVFVIIIGITCILMSACKAKSVYVDDSIEFQYFYADIVDVLVEESVDVTFSANISSSKQLEEIPIQDEGGKILGYMYNNSVNEEDNSNSFIGKVTLKSNIEKHEKIVAVIGDVKSEPIDIFFYKELTEVDYEQLNSLNNDLFEIQKDYFDTEGYVQDEYIDELLVAVEQYVEDEKESGYITYSNKNVNNIYIEFSNGIGYLFIPKQKEMLSSGEPKRITSLEPVKDSFAVSSSLGMTWIDKKVNNLSYQGDYDVESNINMIKENIGEYFELNYNQYVNKDVTVDSIKHLTGSKIIIWEGHGANSEEHGSVLVTRESASKVNNLTKYSADLKEKRLLTTGGWQTLGTDFIFCDYVVTPKFFDYYYSEKSLEGCLVFLGACGSGSDSRLADSLINKGAVGVFCSNGTIFFEYEMLMRTTIFYNLLNQTKEGSYMTTKEALVSAWKEIGAYDPKNKETFITYYGDENYRLIDNEEEEQTVQDDTMQETFVEESEIDLYGEWEIDTDYTDDHNAKTTFDMFGTGYYYDRPILSLNEDKTFSYGVGIGYYGTGTYEIVNDIVKVHIDNYTEYEPDIGYDFTMEILDDNDRILLVQKGFFDGFDLYWKKTLKDESSNNTLDKYGYNKILDKYSSISRNSDYNEMEQIGINPILVNKLPDYADELYYTLYDVNKNDGIPELIIACGEEKVILDVWSSEKRLFSDDYILGEKNSCTIGGDGRLYWYEVHGAEEAYMHIYVLGDGGNLLEQELYRAFIDENNAVRYWELDEFTYFDLSEEEYADKTSSNYNNGTSFEWNHILIN